MWQNRETSSLHLPPTSLHLRKSTSSLFVSSVLSDSPASMSCLYFQVVKLGIHKKQMFIIFPSTSRIALFVRMSIVTFFLPHLTNAHTHSFNVWSYLMLTRHNALACQMVGSRVWGGGEGTKDRVFQITKVCQTTFIFWCVLGLWYLLKNCPKKLDNFNQNWVTAATFKFFAF